MHFSAVFFLIFAFSQTGYCLDCLTCHNNRSILNPDPCKNSKNYVKCTEPAVCLSATYSVNDQFTHLKTFTTVKSCYIKHGKECVMFEDHAKKSAPPQSKVEMLECTVSKSNTVYCNFTLIAILIFVYYKLSE